MGAVENVAPKGSPEQPRPFDARRCREQQAAEESVEVADGNAEVGGRDPVQSEAVLSVLLVGTAAIGRDPRLLRPGPRARAPAPSALGWQGHGPCVPQLGPGTPKRPPLSGASPLPSVQGAQSTETLSTILRTPLPMPRRVA